MKGKVETFEELVNSVFEVDEVVGKDMTFDELMEAFNTVTSLVFSYNAHLHGMD